ncbi:MAG: MOSC domain-containing protein [Pyrinomonadaceae bacterium]
MAINLHRTTYELLEGLKYIKNSPKNFGTLELIVCRPNIGERTELVDGVLDMDNGLVGDNWKTRGSNRTNDGTSNAEMQLTLMNSRAIELIAGLKERRKLAGDQLYVNLNLSPENLPAGTCLQIGDAVIEVTSAPHTGCKAFRERFGIDALRFVNSSEGKRLNLRGINSRIIKTGKITLGDEIVKR